MSYKTNVYLVGTGPGDSELVTIKGLRAIKEADVILYDRLIPLEVLQYAKPNCQLIDSGKAPNKHKLTQSEINNLLVSKAAQGKIVVRLKGGDPFVFGRGGEEAVSLERAGINYEIIPGITSPIGVNEYAGIPVTYRDVSTSFHVITGSEDPNKSDTQVNYQALAKLDGTLIFLMGIERIEEITNSLIEHGKDPDTPTAVISCGCTASEKKVFSSLKLIKDEVQKKGIKAPGIITVGKVVEFGKVINWRKSLPLNGKRILTTRDKKQKQLKDTLLRLGAEVITYPSISVNHKVNLTKETFNKIMKSKFILFTSPTGVEAFWTNLRDKKIDFRHFHQTKIAAIGSSTKNALEQKGVVVDIVPNTFTLEGVVEALSSKVKAGDTLYHIKGNLGRQVVKEELTKIGVSVFEEVVYEVKKVKDLERLEKIKEKTFDYILFTSPSAVKYFSESLTDLGISINNKLIKKSTIGAIGPVTQKACRDMGLTADIIPGSYTIDGLVERIVEEEC
ncbi:uroporphyrinogen-III C-methyltransferase [Proteinivorax tanatarense]|uniref:uroporphyrinogen-III C-methyltransferase n=1 Tax=Proteinivorax tanatarense TaxID=1260629 RepID=A0AAU7VJL5_9FIRM